MSFLEYQEKCDRAEEGAVSTSYILGSVLLPQLGKQGYHKSMIFEPILGAGGLAVL